MYLISTLSTKPMSSHQIVVAGISFFFFHSSIHFTYEPLTEPWSCSRRCWALEALPTKRSVSQVLFYKGAQTWEKAHTQKSGVQVTAGTGSAITPHLHTPHSNTQMQWHELSSTLVLNLTAHIIFGSVASNESPMQIMTRRGIHNSCS